ncbi:MAG TPA: AAA family ATPase [Thauera aminoaromatica]|uniref:McrB family protein n=1 Tax=Accumulibacter sp. TaxID=2053492 RepID=UPI00287ADE56|nr:AAA family ATPase [Accumulibacter sp.]HNF77592.1 AAA family ATPase [Thauera aminoaromatica]HNN46644.1 AAA family ATPase [Azospira sp.]MDS4053510.1 AAA family ATPase [Accumulibacter sp.]HMW64127.1 AAA family ATPase [Accumulibacter sp.]HMW81636.1 AAA family ATPase [Accumulibacter sp.]
MAIYSEYDTAPIYAAAKLFCERCLIADGSLLGDGPLWTPENLRRLHDAFVKDPDEGDRSFTDKFRDQIAKAGEPSVARLAAEVVAVHFLFPSNVGRDRKSALVAEILAWGGATLTEGNVLEPAFLRGIGSGGQGYNARRFLEIAFLIEFALEWKQRPLASRVSALADPWAFMAAVDAVEGAETRQLRHMLVHLTHPESFERIASREHKRRVAAAFSSLLGGNAPDDVDRCLLAVRQVLEQLLGRKNFDFYWPPLVDVWNDQGDAGDAGIPLDALRHKRQIVLYGPPGTGKTYRAKSIAERLIRPALLAAMGPHDYFGRQAEVADGIQRRTHRLQLHPAYGYEDFIRGLHIDGRGGTEYRPGYLPRLVAEMGRDDPSIPHVLILDEMNRADLSRTLGEAFSLLEDRGQNIELPGAGADGRTTTLGIPENLYVIGTMNLIDQSVEQMDFALRRRFLWVRCSFDRVALVSASKARWERAGGRIAWERVASDFERLAMAAEALNREIADSPLLGSQYEIGHAYLLDAVSFLREDMGPAPRTFLWANDRAKRPVEQTWELSLRPLLEEYLAGLDARSRKSELAKLQAVFLRPPVVSD